MRSPPGENAGSETWPVDSSRRVRTALRQAPGEQRERGQHEPGHAPPHFRHRPRAAKVHLRASVEVAAHRGNRVAAGKYAELGLLIEEVVDAGVDVHVVTEVVTHVDIVIPLLLHLEVAWIAVVGIARQHLRGEPVRLAEPVDAIGRSVSGPRVQLASSVAENFGKYCSSRSLSTSAPGVDNEFELVEISAHELHPELTGAVGLDAIVDGDVEPRGVEARDVVGPDA